MDSKRGLQIQATVKLQQINSCSLQSALTAWARLTLKLPSLFNLRLVTGLGSALWVSSQRQDQDWKLESRFPGLWEAHSDTRYHLGTKAILLHRGKCSSEDAMLNISLKFLKCWITSQTKIEELKPSSTNVLIVLFCEIQPRETEESPLSHFQLWQYFSDICAKWIQFHFLTTQARKNEEIKEKKNYKYLKKFQW